MGESLSGRDPVEELAEEFLERVRRGERPSVTEYVERYPEHGDTIRELFPAIAKLEAVRPRDHELEDGRASIVSGAGLQPERLGDFRIIREVGRGGMGVVYEAEQVSLGRRVALKVLVTPQVRDGRSAERFRREARAASRLHHTNIVPVYEVGQQGGTVFYAMQLIQGQSLDLVVKELLRLQAPAGEVAAPGPTSPGDGAAAQKRASPNSTSNVSSAFAPTLHDSEGMHARQLSWIAQSILTGWPAPEGGNGLDGGSPAAAGLERDHGVGAAGLAIPSDAARIKGAGSSDPSSAVLPGGTQVASVDPKNRGHSFYRSVAQVGRQVAEGLDYAHARGIIHRDIKPSNLLLDTAGIVWITDFGLAKGDEADLTQTGELVGTIRYMPPERFQGEGDARSDIYSLGLTLYELVASRPAFESSDRIRLMDRIRSEEPRRLRALDPNVPRDLETIIFKAMARDPAHRYATALELIDDLRRFLEDRPIRARRAAVWERGARWCRRNPVVAGLAAALFFVLFTGFIVAAVQWRRADAEAIRARLLARHARFETARANQTARAEAEARAAESALRIEAQAAGARGTFERGLELARRGEADHGLLSMVESLVQSPAERPEFDRMARAAAAGWENQTYPLRAILEHRGGVSTVAFRGDGRVILTGDLPGFAQLWDAITGRPIGPPMDHKSRIYFVEFSQNGRVLFTGGEDGTVRVWDAESGRPAGQPMSHDAPIDTVAVSPDGTLLATRTNRHDIWMWDALSGELRWGPIGAGKVRSLQFSPEGRLLLTGDERGNGSLLDVSSGKLVGASLVHGVPAVAVFSPDGSLIATAGQDGGVRLWETASRGLKASGPTSGVRISHVTFSPDGRLLLSVHDDGAARLWDVARASPIGRPMHQGGEMCRPCFSPDGRRIVLASSERAARIWDVATGKPIGSPLRHRRGQNTPRFSPDGRLVVTSSGDGTAKVWEVDKLDLDPLVEIAHDLPEAAEPAIRPRGGSQFTRLIFSPDRSRLLLGAGGLARLIETSSGQPIGRPIKVRWPTLRAMAFSPGNDLVAIASHDRSFLEGGSTSTMCQVWDATSGRARSPQLPHSNWVAALAFGPDGKLLATGDFDGNVQIWETGTGKLRQVLRHPGAIILCVAFSPDGRTLAVGTAEHAPRIAIWNLETASRRGEPIRFANWVTRVAFSPDGSRLAAGSNDCTVRLIDTATATTTGDVLQHASIISGLAFSPDGKRLASANAGGSGTGATRLWDTRTGKPASPVLPLPAPLTIGALAFSADSSALAAGCKDGSVLLWDVDVGRLVHPVWRLRNPCLSVAFIPEGQSLMALDDRGGVRTWHFSRAPKEPLERLRLRAQTRTGLELDASGAITILDAQTWRERRARLGESWSSSDDRSAELAWHESCARDAETVGYFHAAAWHLDRQMARRPADGLLTARRAVALLCARDVSAGEAGLRRAIEIGPRDRILDWLVQRAEDLRNERNPEDALRLLDAVVSVRPSDWLTYAVRADCLAALGRTALREADLMRAVERDPDSSFLLQLAVEKSRAGRWAEAVGLFDQAMNRGAIPFEAWQQAAIAHLEIDDAAGFRRVCKAMLSKYSAVISDPGVKLTVAGICNLGTDAAGDDARVLAWIEPLPGALNPANKTARRSCLQTLGAILYRLGRYREAIERINEGVALGDGGMTREESAFLAMAQFRIGEREKARAILKAPLREEHDEPSSAKWWEARARHVLWREAVRLILEQAVPIDPFEVGSRG
jgi:WD40 repeat protein/serine/threonine protein kinase/tetratricopeptide (TPR) repeat protein